MDNRPIEKGEPRAPEVRPEHVQRAELAMFGLILVAAGLAMFSPPLALIAPGVYLLVVTFPRRR